MVLKLITFLRNWRSTKVNFDEIKVISMVIAAMGASVFAYYLNERNKLKPSPLIPAESFQHYVEIQKKAGKEV